MMELLDILWLFVSGSTKLLLATPLAELTLGVVAQAIFSWILLLAVGFFSLVGGFYAVATPMYMIDCFNYRRNNGTNLPETTS